MQPLFSLLLLGVAYSIEIVGTRTSRIKVAPTPETEYEARKLMYPFVAAVLYNDWVQCGATMYKTHVALTSADCTMGRIEAYRIVTKLHNTSQLESASKFKVKDISRHPKFKPVTMAKYNIAILTLDAPPDNEPMLALDHRGTGKGMVYVIGWGYSQGHWTRSPVVRNSFLPILGKELCTSLKGRPIAHATEFCIGEAQKNAGTYLVDPGSPAVTIKNGQFQLLGIASWSEVYTKDSYLPTVFSRISHYADWIKSKSH
ncbi:hypothetical protein DSO57_1032907 [Entomophthora muscae]|uniref:Uncharacterized protein n=1 Tax=Entomophthora muscae TaxID=34485 RepID=A0ACC2SD22_9FUNG|nr:hypothetical protein DSO57_1032907 [Entomophthora muscae]